MKKRALLLDLDGTLLDTAPDMADALNKLLVEMNREPLPFADIRKTVSHGNLRMLQLAFGAENVVEGGDLQKRFLNIYRQALAVKTKLFDGFDQVLKRVNELGMQWGVVTNKPGWLTDPLMAELGLDTQAACIVSGDTVAQRKPHPLPMFHAAQLMSIEPQACLYVGDAERDIQAGNAAGMTTLVALWGYLGENDKPHEWRGHGIVDTPNDLIEWLN
ncbi:MAG TPA: phosphoglycolate phosphatase [Steroidobacteraceae bacterium]|jgi:phosphoglycolate phosphatase|nr:phosphoglycolate phosphatase [Steroidobacteraceae bacterium]